MKRCVLTATLLGILSAPAVAQSALNNDDAILPTSLSDGLREDPAPGVEDGSEPSSEPFHDPLFDPTPAPAEKSTELSLGAAVGYLHARGADRGTWLAGVQGRLHFLKYLAAEGSITFHENRYQNGDARVTQYPVQVSGLFYPIPDSQVQPYVVAGGGWYYTRITYVGSLSGIRNQTDHVFGGHAGAGLEIRLGTSTSIDADLRYIFLNPSNTAVKSRDFNYWQGTAGINFFF